jgi:murein DD-endopeptidase MepM/ murein hydrolase activator NlpD
MRLTWLVCASALTIFASSALWAQEPPPVESHALPPIGDKPATPVQGEPAYAPAAPPPRTSTAPAPPPARMTATGKVTAATGLVRVYTVAKGDHIDLIARDLQTTRAVIVEANHLKPPFAIRPGQKLKIPVEKVYVATSGDTLSAIARRFSVTLADLADLNSLSPRAHIRAGDRIALPAEYTDKGPVAWEAEAAVPVPVRRWGGPAYTPSAEAIAAAERRNAAGYAPESPVRGDLVATGKGRFIWPVQGDVTTRFGAAATGRRSDGIDIKAPEGTPVKASAAGDVVYAGNQVPGFGNLVLVKHADGWVTAYAHLQRIDVQMRQSVTQGEAIGAVGMTGGWTEPGLHFEIRFATSPTEKAKPIDPLQVLPAP